MSEEATEIAAKAWLGECIEDKSMNKLMLTASITGALLAVTAAIPGIAYVTGSTASSQSPKIPAGQGVTTLNVINVSCATCAPIVKAALSRIPGVTKVSVEETVRGSATARVIHDPKLVSPAALAAAVTEAGYPAEIAR